MSVQGFKNINNLKNLFVNPMGFISKGLLKIKTLVNEFRIDGSTQAMITHNRKLWKGWANPKADNIVLVEMHHSLGTLTADFYFTNVFARKKNARIVSFGRFRWNRKRALHALYKSGNAAEHITAHELSAAQEKRCRELFSRIRPSLKTKQDVFDLAFDGVNIGIDVFETYLREFNKPTLYFDAQFDSILEWAIGVYIYWSDYLQANKVVGIAVSHDCYIDCNILNRLAYKMKIPVFIPWYFSIVRCSRPHTWSARFLAYKRWFDQMTDEVQKAAVIKAKAQIEKRFQGKFEGDIWYMKVSAYQQPVSDKRVLRESNKLKVLICTHCFFDSPQYYGGMLFHDFHDWLSFLARIAQKTDYDWYLKTHPHPRPGTDEVIRSILGENSPITVIPSATSPHQLVKEGVSHVLTVYGTVGHEYPAMGVQVVNAGYNPHIAFNFNWTPKNLKEYESWLMDLSSINKKIDLNEVYQFYFMYHYYSVVDDLIFPSAKAILAKIGQAGMDTSTKVFSCILQDWNKDQHQKVIDKIERYIDADKDFLYLKGPISLKENEFVKDALCNPSRMDFPIRRNDGPHQTSGDIGRRARGEVEAFNGLSA